MSIAAVAPSVATTRPDVPTAPPRPQAPEGAVVVRAGGSASSEVVTLPRPEEVPPADERRPIDAQRFRRVLNKGLRRLARGVRNELRQVARDLELDRGERRELRREVRGAYKEFRSELRDAFRASRSDETIDSNALVGTIKSSFRGLIADIKQIVRDAAAGQVEEPVEEPTVRIQPEPAESPVERQGGAPAGAVVVAASSTTNSSATTVSAPTDTEDAVAAPFAGRASSFIESYRSVITRVEGPDGQVTTTSTFTYQSATYDYYAS